MKSPWRNSQKNRGERLSWKNSREGGKRRAQQENAQEYGRQRGSWRSFSKDGRRRTPFFERSLDSLFQDRDSCAICGEKGEFPSRLCPDCWDRFIYAGSCRPLDFESENPLLCYSGYLYNNFLKEYFAAYKFEGASYLEEVFSALLSYFYDQAPFQNCRWIAYMPSSPRREILRGYNPAQKLAENLAKEKDLYLVHALEKTRQTREQNKINRVERLTNIRGSLALRKEKESLTAARWNREKENGKFFHEEIVHDETSYKEALPEKIPPRTWLAAARWDREEEVWREFSLPLAYLQREEGLLLDDFLTSGATMGEGLSVLKQFDLQASGLTLGVASMPDEDFLLKSRV